MEYKTISEIRDLCANSSIYGATIDRYIRNLVREDGWRDQELRIIMAEMRSPITEHYTPIESDFVISYIKAFLYENFNDISYLVINSRLCVENIEVVKITMNNTSHCIFCHPAHRREIEELLTMLSADVPVNLDYSTESLASEEEFNVHRAYLAHLGLIPMNEEELENAVIPKLSDTFLIDEDTARFSSAIWFEEIQKKEIILAGLGGIGSWTALLLGRVKPARMYLYDDDVGENVNMAGQLYSTEDLGRSKVDATAIHLSKFASYYNVVALRERYEKDSPAADIMICGFDNMKARAVFFRNWIEHVKSKSDEDRKHCLFIDGRLAAEELQVLCIAGDDSKNINRYAKDFIFKDEEANETLCSYKQTSYMANMIGGFIVNLFTNFVANEICEGIRDLPFLTSYIGDTMISKIEF